MVQRSLKKGGRQKKTKICKKKGGLRKTKKRGGGLLSLFGNISRVGVGLRNASYKDTLENRLVNQYNDYDWVQKRRYKNTLPRKEKSEYTENDKTSDSYEKNKDQNKYQNEDQNKDQNKDQNEDVKKGWFW